ncbi:MAG: N-acetyltransferase [Elusimicrobiota bacterium]|jgi:amino-acid N-acetyltransferase|nr:N-acetyltransferase [Elusimicrobiota bacterium]
MKIRTAKVGDAMKIHELVEYYADNREMLHRSLNAIYENIQEFVVVEDEGDIVGCGALHITWGDLAEIKALAVSEDYKGQGLGRKIVATLQNNAVDLGVYKVFALSFKPDFFKKLGYEVISKETLPHKIWSECINCHLFPDCGETPLLITLKEEK